jgi:hypothetical protein
VGRGAISISDWAALDNPRFLPVFDAIAECGLGIWLHPVRGPVPDYPTSVIGWVHTLG